MKRELSAYLTIYLALTLGVLVSLSLALIEGTRVSTLQLETVCIADTGMDSVMAEYHRELFQRFQLLAIDSSYGTKTVGCANTEARLEKYLKKNIAGRADEEFGVLADWVYKDFLALRLEELELEEVSILTDDNGTVFRRQAVEALKEDLGIAAMEEMTRWMKTVKEFELDTRDVEAEKTLVDEEISDYNGKKIRISEGKWETLLVENPTQSIEDRKKTGILSQVLGEDRELSPKQVNVPGLVLQRIRDGRVNKGNIACPEISPAAQTLESFLFQEYLMRYLGNYLEKQENTALDYELEYVIAGKSSDAENLESVLLRLAAMREAANAVYLFADEKKYGEADLIAWGLSLVLQVPELQALFRTSILLGWAYAESIHDLQVLLEGGRIPLLKTSESWHYDLETILQDLWGSCEAGEGSGGLAYGDYLRILLMLTNPENLTGRAMDMVEADIRRTPGNEAFRLDGCYVELRSRIVVGSGYGYRQEIFWEKKY